MTDESGNLLEFPVGHPQEGQLMIDQDLVNYNLTAKNLADTSIGEFELCRWFKGQVQPHLSLADTKKIIVPIPKESFQLEIESLIKKSYADREESQSLYTQAQELLERELGLDKLKLEKPISYEARLTEIVDSIRLDAQHFKSKYTVLLKHIKSKRHSLKSIKRPFKEGGLSNEKKETLE